jgi:hypothetical protein
VQSGDYKSADVLIAPKDKPKKNSKKDIVFSLTLEYSVIRAINSNTKGY